jgi:GT2 family glycosyltransferase
MSAPEVTVVVPTRDRPSALAACMSALAALTPPAGGFEVVVVDDGSTSPVSPPTPPRSSWTELRVLRIEHAGPAAARNAGAAAACGELLAFTDDDCRPEADWLVTLRATLDRHVVQAAGGPLVNVVAGDAWAAASHTLFERLYDWYNADPADARFLASSNLIVRRTAFDAIGGFDTAFPAAAGEDRDLCERLREAGLRLAFAPAARVGHAHPLGMRGFWRQHSAYGRGAARFHRLRAARRGEAVRGEPLGFYAHLLRGEPRVGGRIAVAQLANAVGAALEWREAAR